MSDLFKIAESHPDYNPNLMPVTPEQIRETLLKADADLRSYYAYLVLGNLEIFDRLQAEPINETPLFSPDIYKLDRPQICAYRLIRSVLEVWAAEFDRSAKTQEDLAELNVRFEAFCYGDGPVTGIGTVANALLFTFARLESQIWLKLDPRSQALRMGLCTELLKQCLPSVSEEDLSRFLQIRRDIGAFSEYVCLAGGTDPENVDVSLPPRSQPLLGAEIASFAGKLNSKARAQFAFLHNRLIGIVLNAGLSVEELRNRLADTDPGSEIDVLRQLKECNPLRMTLRRDAKSLKIGTLESAGIEDVFSLLRRHLEKPIMAPLSAVLRLLLEAASVAANLDLSQLRSSLDASSLSSEDRLTILAAVAVLDVWPKFVSSNGRLSVKLGRVDPRTITVPSFDAVKVWQSLAGNLSLEDRHRFAFALQNAFVLIDEVRANKLASAQMSSITDMRNPGRWRRLDEMIGPARALLIPALTDISQYESPIGCEPAENKTPFEWHSITLSFAGRVVEAVDSLEPFFARESLTVALIGLGDFCLDASVLADHPEYQEGGCRYSLATVFSLSLEVSSLAMVAVGHRADYCLTKRREERRRRV